MINQYPRYCECGTLTESEYSSDHACYPEKNDKQIKRDSIFIHDLLHDIDSNERSVI